MHEPAGRDGRLLASLVMLLAAVTLAACAARYLPSPLRFDEAEWPPQAEGILRHGVPMLEYAEDRRLFPTAYFGYDAHYGMWHPPLYQYSLAGVLAVCGDGNVAVRSLSLAWSALAVWLAWLVVMQRAPARDLGLRVLPIGVAALCPLVIHGSFFLDIDNTSLCAAVFFMAWLHVTLAADRPWRRRAWLALAFAFALWSKLTTPLLMLAAIGTDLTSRRRFRQAVIETLAIGVGGAVLFAAGYWLYCAALDYPAGFMFDVVYRAGRSHHIASVHPLARAALALRWNLVWVSPPLLAAFVWVVALRARRYVREPGSEPADVVMIFAGLTLAAYSAIGAMGKYTVPAAVGMAMVVGAEAARVLESLRWRGRALIAAAAGALAILHVWILRPLTVRPAAAATPDSLAGMFADPRVLPLAAAVAAGVIVVSVVARQMRTSVPGSAVLAALLLWLVAANPASELRVAASRYDRSPLRPFEETGFAAVVAFVNEHARPDDRLLCPKDVGYYFRGRFIAFDPGGAGEGPEGPLAAARANGVRFVVDSTLYPVVPARHIEAAGFARRVTMGDFAVYERRD